MMNVFIAAVETWRSLILINIKTSTIQVERVSNRNQNRINQLICSYYAIKNIVFSLIHSLWNRFHQNRIGKVVCGRYTHAHAYKWLKTMHVTPKRHTTNSYQMIHTRKCDACHE